MFKRDVYHVVEIKEADKLPELTADIRNGLRALNDNPYFLYLLKRFRIKKAGVETALREGFNLTDQQVRYCQAGAFWASELERDIKNLTQDTSQARPATTDEMAEFKKMANSISLVGQD